MCGRFTLNVSREKLIQTFLAEMNAEMKEQLKPKFNIAPGSGIIAVVDDWERGQRQFEIFHWGLVPGWAKDPDIGIKLVNARSETVAEKAAFKEALKYRRCLIPASGFYEWDRNAASSQPYYFTSPKKKILAFAGLWEHWASPDGSEILSATLLTRQANNDMEPIHHRMPLILSESLWEQWLDSSYKPVDRIIQDAGRLQDREHLQFIPVSPAVNNTRNDNAELIERWISPDDQQMNLF